LIDRLASEPRELARMRAEPSLIDGWIEEGLRLDPPAQFVMRTVREARTLARQALQVGEYMVVYLAAANRDPARWQDPASFRPRRERERNLAFGYGIHSCLGATLARLETQVALQSLAARFDSVARGSAPKERLRSTLLYGFRRLPVVFL
jgi:cytochrome P450